jgi:hypothetical protein
MQQRLHGAPLPLDPTWASPNTTVTSKGTFGTITTASGQRTLQFALKLNY